MKYTIINDATNEIVRVLKIPNALIDAETDKEAFLSDALELELEEGQIAVEGNYPPSLFTYDGSDFHEIILSETLEPVLLPTDELLLMLITQLRDEGYSLPLHRKFMRTKAQAKEMIDLSASRACERYVSKGKFTPLEYMVTSQHVLEWRALGSPMDAVPEMLQSWFDNSEHTTVEEAAVDIEAQALQMNTVIASTRRIRLQGKRQVSLASLETFKDVANTYINQLDQIGVPQE